MKILIPKITLFTQQQIHKKFAFITIYHNFIFATSKANSQTLFQQKRLFSSRNSLMMKSTYTKCWRSHISLHSTTSTDAKEKAVFWPKFPFQIDTLRFYWKWQDWCKNMLFYGNLKNRNEKNILVFYSKVCNCISSMNIPLALSCTPWPCVCRLRFTPLWVLSFFSQMAWI